MFNEILILIGLTLLPFLELRASIPYGILNTNIHWASVFFICVIANAMLAPIVYLFVDKGLHFFLRINILNKLYGKYVIKAQNKIRPYVDKYGFSGIALFIGVPLPGSGVYSGAIGSYVLGLGFKRFLIASILGVIIAGIAVTIVTLTGATAFNIFLKI